MNLNSKAFMMLCELKNDLENRGIKVLPIEQRDINSFQVRCSIQCTNKYTPIDHRCADIAHKIIKECEEKMTEETIIDTKAIANQVAAAKRLRRKLDILRLDAKSRSNDQLKADINECIALLDIMEKRK